MYFYWQIDGLDFVKESARFLSYLKFERRFSAHTLTAYESDLLQFSDYLQIQYQLDDIQQVNHMLIRSWVVSLIEAKLNPRSVNRKITSLRSFFRFLQREKIVKVNPMLKIKAPKSAKRLPEYVDDKRMEIVLAELDAIPEYDSIRNHLILEFFYMTGVRLSELVGLKMGDVNLYNLSISVFGKRSKVRQIPITNVFKRKLEVYLTSRKSFLQEMEKEIFQ